MFEFGFFYIFQLLPLDNWDWCAIMNHYGYCKHPFFNKLYYDKKKQFKKCEVLYLKTTILNPLTFNRWSNVHWQFSRSDFNPCV